MSINYQLILYSLIYIYQSCVVWYSKFCSDDYLITVDQPELAFGQNLFFFCCGWVFFYRYRGSQDLPLNELKPKSLESIIEAWTSTEKTEKTHHEHGGLLCFLAVNSACVMTKELSSFWTKGSRFVLEPQTISWLSGPICSLLLTEPGPIVFCDYNSPVCVQLWRRIKKRGCAIVLHLDAWKWDIFFSVKVVLFPCEEYDCFLFCSVFLRVSWQLYVRLYSGLGFFYHYTSTDLY